MPQTYRIITYGCQMNVHESEKIAGVLEEAGYLPTADDLADVVVLNTCCVRESAETHVLGNLGALKKQWEEHGTKIVVCGCMTQADGAAQKLQARCPFIHAILGTHNVEDIPALLSRNGKKTQICVKEPCGVTEGTPIRRKKDVNAWVNIMYGCNNFCSYCIVPYVRGRERSRTKESILADVKSLIGQGYKQITLLGQNVDSYGADLGKEYTFSALLADIAALSGKFRIKFMTSHPKDIVPETIKTIAQSEKLSKFIHMPAQSGSDRILRLMNRKYTRDTYLEKIETVRSFIPDAGLSGDMMVGFPTETDTDVADTLALIDTVRYDNLYTFIYSRRKGTPADRMDGQVPLSEKKKRIKLLIDAQFSVAVRLAEAAVGREYTALFTEFRDGKLLGETESGKAVIVCGTADDVGTFRKIRITRNDKTKLFGEIL